MLTYARYNLLQTFSLQAQPKNHGLTFHNTVIMVLELQDIQVIRDQRGKIFFITHINIYQGRDQFVA